MTNWDAIVRLAKDCHTKAAWENLFSIHGDAIATTNNSRPLQEIFKSLRADTQSLQYDSAIWENLIQGCHSSWNLELGREIAEFSKKVTSAGIAIQAARLYLESHPSQARDIASRALRLANIQPKEKLQLEMLTASSYAEEGKRQKTIRQLAMIRNSIKQPVLTESERADFLTSMGRMQFLLGRYQQAAELFYETADQYKKVQDWENAVKSIFNAAACYLNSGTKGKDEAFAMIEECRKLAEAANLPGPLSHCEAAYGMDAYQRGDYAAAREHLRRALEYLPTNDKSYRRLHILSMLSFTYIAMGRYHLANKFGRQTLDLAALDESERFKTRYINLRAELSWEEGLVEESQQILAPTIAILETKGIHTLEELALVTRYNLQSSLLNSTSVQTKYSIDDSLKRNQYSWLDFIYSCGQLALNKEEYSGAEKSFTECLQKGRLSGDRCHEALGLLGMIQSRLRQRKPEDCGGYFRDFEVTVARIGETPLKTTVYFIQAAIAYQGGDFENCVRILRQAGKNSRISFADKFVVLGWLATLDGKSSRLTAEWQSDMMARYTKTYFSPSIEAIDDRHFKVSEHYIVSLERHPSLAELLLYLMLKSSYSASSAEIQTHVWKQSLHSQGWQQKIRNTIMRLRDFFPFTIAPLIMHSENISLFKDAIYIQPIRKEGLETDEEIVRLLQDSPMSSADLAKRLNISAATTKRILKKMAEDNLVTANKHGRNIFYTAQEKNAPN